MIGYFYDADETGGYLELHILENDESPEWEIQSNIIMGAPVSSQEAFQIFKNMNGYLNSMMVETSANVGPASIDTSLWEGTQFY